MSSIFTTDDRGFMEDSLAIFHRLFKFGCVEDAGLRESQSSVALMLGEVFQATGGEIIDYSYLAILSEEMVNKMASNEASSTCNHRSHEV